MSTASYVDSTWSLERGEVRYDNDDWIFWEPTSTFPPLACERISATVLTFVRKICDLSVDYARSNFSPAPIAYTRLDGSLAAQPFCGSKLIKYLISLTNYVSGPSRNLQGQREYESGNFTNG